MQMRLCCNAQDRNKFFIAIMTQFFFSPTSDFFTEDLVSHKMHKDSFPVAGRKECMFCDSSAKHGRAVEWNRLLMRNTHRLDSGL